MRVAAQEDSTYVLSVDRGEEIISALEEFCEARGIRAGIFQGIGAVNELELWWYNPLRKQYHKKEFFRQLEVASLSGNVGVLQGDVIAHAHGVFSDEEFHSYSGHVYKAVVSGACEIFLGTLKEPINRMYDEETGLNLIH